MRILLERACRLLPWFDLFRRSVGVGTKHSQKSNEMGSNLNENGLNDKSYPQVTKAY